MPTPTSGWEEKSAHPISCHSHHDPLVEGLILLPHLPLSDWEPDGFQSGPGAYGPSGREFWTMGQQDGMGGSPGGDPRGF